MKRVVFISAMCAFLLASTPVLADFYGGTGDLSQTGGNYSSGNGGEFTISNSTLSISAYAPGVTSQITGNPNSFQTFCLETTEFTASQIDIMVSTRFINEGTGADDGPGSHAIFGSNQFGDNLDPLTAYLYTQFATGVLTGYDYDDLGVGRDVSAGALQRLIWVTENEPGSDLTNNPYYGISLDGNQRDLIDMWVTEYDDSSWTGIGNVRVLNNWAQGYVGISGYEKQDQLYLTPVPGAVLLGMIGLGVAGVKLRKFA